jgi:ABC-2 type transport system permease protein
LSSELAPQLRRFGAVNWLGFWTLYEREVRRFFKVSTQTIVAPVVTTLLFLAVFLLALGGEQRHVGNIPYVEFLAPGLIMMAMAQNAFANTSSSLMIAKVQGNIVDVLMPPLSAGELTWAFALGGVTRCRSRRRRSSSFTRSPPRSCCRCSAFWAASGPTNSTTSPPSRISW